MRMNRGIREMPMGYRGPQQPVSGQFNGYPSQRSVYNQRGLSPYEQRGTNPFDQRAPNAFEQRTPNSFERGTSPFEHGSNPFEQQSNLYDQSRFSNSFH